MTHETPDADWNPRSDTVQGGQFATFDEMRHHCPVANIDYMGWFLFKHQDMLDVLNNHHTFSHSVSNQRFLYTADIGIAESSICPLMLNELSRRNNAMVAGY